MAVELATAYVSLVPSAVGIKGKIAQELNLDAAATAAGVSAGRSLSRSLIAGATAAAAGVAIGAFFRAAFKEAEEAQKVSAQTEAVLKSTGHAAHVSAAQVGELAIALSKKVGIDDEVIQSGENVLLTFTRVRNEAGKGNDVFTRATKLALDMSVALGTDLSAANLKVGKALQDPIKGIATLTRFGVVFTEQQKDQVKALVASGDLLGAQKIILRELAVEFGGSAAAQATAADKAGVAIKNLQESVGIALMPAIEAAANAFSFFTNILNDLPEPLRTIIVDVGLLGGGVLAAAFVVSRLGGAFSLISSGSKLAGEAIAGLTSLVKAFTIAELAAAAAPFAFVAGVVVAGLAIDKFAAGSEGGLTKFAQAAARGAEAGKKFGQSLVNAATQSETPIRMLNAQQDALKEKIQDVTREHEAGNISIDEAVAARTRLKFASSEVGAAIDKEKAAQDAQNAARTAAIQGINAYTLALALGATQETALAAAGDKGREAIQNLQNVLLAAAGGALGYAQSQANLVKAQNDYNTAVEQFGPASAEAQAAQLALNQAQLANVQAAQSADAAQQTLIQSLVSGNTTYEQQRAMLDEQIRLHPENAAGIQLEIDKLDAAKVAADAIPGSKTIKVTADVQAAIDALNRVVDAANNVKDAVISGIGSAFNIPGRMAGGPVSGGNPYIVGEQGPELFIPRDSGTIIPHAQTVAMAGGGLFSGATVVIGDSNVIPDLDYFARTRMAGV